MSVHSAAFDESKSHKGVFQALLNARSRFGGTTEIILDADDRVLTYDELVRASFALGSSMKKLAKQDETVGVMLPTGIGAVISFFALNAYGRVPAMLNFTSGTKNLKSAIEAAKIKHVVTAHKFVELAELDDLVDDLKEHAGFVYLEDIREQLTATDKLAGALGPYVPWAFRAKPHHDATGVILFTSGTEGAPKGVALSHKNIVSNVQQIIQHVPTVLTPGKILFNPLPTFHCFGLTAGAILPLLNGMKSALYPSPLRVKEIPKRIEETGSQILFATDTFISQYARSNAEALKSLDYIVCGAERVKDETRQLINRLTGIDIIEGYGVTETSPVLSVNTPESNRHGTVGIPLAGMELAFEPVTGINDAGRLKVRGPNIMKGYIHPETPGVVQPLDGGWHDTGDVVGMDEEGCLVIRGRLKRFAKLGGEMVSLAVVENCAYAVWPEHDHAAAALPDKRKGEQVVLLTTNPTADRTDLSRWIQNHGVSELSLPKKIYQVDEIPLLGTGKMDIGAVQKIAADVHAQQAASPPSPAA